MTSRALPPRRATAFTLEGLEARTLLSAELSLITAAPDMMAPVPEPMPTLRLDTAATSTGIDPLPHDARRFDFVRPEAHGAVGDGITDDTAALQAALNTGKMVLLSEKTYKIVSRINLVSSGGIMGHGERSVLYMGSQAGEFDHPSADPQGRFGTNAVGIYALDQSHTLLQGFVVRKEVMDGRYVRAVAIRGGTDHVVKRLEVTGFALGGGLISFDSVTSGGRITDCSIHDNTSNHHANGQITGIEIDNDRRHGVPSDGIVVANNTIRNLTVGSRFLSLFGYQTDGITVAHPMSKNHLIVRNVIEGVGEGIDVYGEGCLIEDNLIRETYIFGIKLVHGAQHDRVIGNTIDRAGLAGIDLAGSSVVPRDTAHNVISGNIITGVNAHGHWNHAITAGVRVEDNQGTTYLPRNNVYGQYHSGRPVLRGPGTRHRQLFSRQRSPRIRLLGQSTSRLGGWQHRARGARRLPRSFRREPARRAA